MALPTDEWLHHAQRLAVGQSARVRHKNELTPAMSVRNMPDRWTCYCHRCHEGGVVMKTHAVLTRLPDQKRFMPWPEDAKPLEEWPLYEQETVYKFLLEKGIDCQEHLSAIPVLYSRSQGRLILGSSQGWLGRATRGQLPKWTGYGYPAPAYGAAPADGAGGRDVVLTEDYLSALKVRWACAREGLDVVAQALLGTELRDRHLLDLLGAGTARAVLFLDGDKAGDRGNVLVSKRLRGAGIRTIVARTPRESDPKDLTTEQIVKIIGECIGTPTAPRSSEP